MVMQDMTAVPSTFHGRAGAWRKANVPVTYRSYGGLKRSGSMRFWQGARMRVTFEVRGSTVGLLQSGLGLLLLLPLRNGMGTTPLTGRGRNFSRTSSSTLFRRQQRSSIQTPRAREEVLFLPGELCSTSLQPTVSGTNTALSVG